MMKGLTQQLHMLGISITNIVHNTYDQYEDFIKSNFNSVSYKNGDCLDDLLFQTLKIDRFLELSQITMIIFVINQGQAHVERGLSINTNVINVNMKEQSIRTKRLVRDHMQKYNLQPATTEITNLLKQSCSTAYQRYRTYLDEEKEKAAKTHILDKEIKEVESKINHLMGSSKVLDKKFVEL